MTKEDVQFTGDVCHLACFSCGDEHPQDELNWVDGAGKRSPRPFCEDCVGPARKGRGDW